MRRRMDRPEAERVARTLKRKHGRKLKVIALSHHGRGSVIHCLVRKGKRPITISRNSNAELDKLTS